MTSLAETNDFVSIIILAIVLLLFMAVVFILLFFFSHKKIVKSKLEKANLQITYQQELLQATLITQEEERARIAQDLHDAISSKLNVVSLQANLLVDKNLTVEDAHKFGAGILKITNTVLESSRKIAHDLLPPTLEKFGLQAALEELLEELEDTNRFEIKRTINIPENYLNKNSELHLFRIVQELLNNAIKHSEATHLELSCTSQNNLLILHYTDNGKGFNADEIKSGLGMSGIANRAQILNSDLTVSSQPGKGVQVRLQIPKNYED
jgi:signal transduction histidine kinase